MKAPEGGRFFVPGKKSGVNIYGDIYLGIDNQTGSEVVITFQNAQNARSKCPDLLHEAKQYKLLVGVIGVPQVHWYGNLGSHKVMICDPLGPTLADLFDDCDGIFGIKTTLMVGLQMLNVIEQLHARNRVHRNICPENMFIGFAETEHVVHLINFSCTKHYRDASTQEHVSCTDCNHLVGSRLFASENAQRGFSQSRRDDLESLGYVLLYFVAGGLPWQQHALGAAEAIAIAEMKAFVNKDAMCRYCPPEFAEFIAYCKALRFEECPDYEYLRLLLTRAFYREGFTCDYVYDWTLLSLSRSQSTSSQRRRRLEHKRTRKSCESESQGNGSCDFLYASSSLSSS
eukprot:TRINITY_DN47736_c0_g1_i1.p1 TRINITY_DN47736_c0_g1~~TRINITY_DN47736_c0_g1_i1.p1  ORF type:complete len:343 (-),score=54.42 TRINITY_DN47736_c0_g1_i1:222-1250(-)